MLDRANSFYCPVGRHPARGWILLRRYDYNLLSKYSTTLQLNISNAGGPFNVAPLNKLSIVNAQCVTRGLSTDPSALYLVEITDRRGILCNNYMDFPLRKSYNIRSQAYPETFMLESMNDYDQPHPSAGSKTTWTWTTMIEDIWDEMSTHLGSFPGLPFAPIGTPEGFFLQGVSAWTALNDILDTLGMTVACNLVDSSPYTIVKIGQTDAAFTVLRLLYTTNGNLEDDLEWIDAGAGRVPGTIIVLFRRRNNVYGTEETTPYRNDAMAEQWVMGDHYAVSITVGTGGVGKHYIWSDYTVRADDNSNVMGADATYATRIAIERSYQYLRKIRWIGTTADLIPTSGTSMEQTYTGALPFRTGSQVDGIAWTQDYSNQAWQGWKTKIVRGPLPPFPEIYGGQK